MRIYISGPMTGIPNFNRAAFKSAAIVLADMGHEVFNPGSLTRPYGTRRQYLEADLVWICSKAEGIVMLFDWIRSTGASAELATANALGLPAWYQVVTDPGKFISYKQHISSTGKATYLAEAISPAAIEIPVRWGAGLPKTWP